MEICRYCGHAGAHAPGCPTLPDRGPEVIDDRESEVPGFSVRETHQIVSVVDFSKKWTYDQETLDRVTPENIDALIKAEERRIVADRKKENDTELPGKLPDELIDLMYERNSSSHAIQCAVNRAEDFGEYADRVRAYAREKGVPGDDPNYAFLSDFLARQETQNDLASELFEIDIARRIGELKGDKAFFERAAARFPELAKRLLASLEEFEAANEEGIGENRDFRQQLDTLRSRIESAKKESADDLAMDFYGDICRGYALLVFYDEEHLNENRVRAAAARVVGKEAPPEVSPDDI